MPENNDTMPNENENQKAQVRNEVNIHKVKAEKNKNALQIVLTVMLLVVSALILKLSDLSGEIPVDTQSGLILINEISSSSQQTLYDEQGDFNDFIELYNNSGETVDLTGWYLSDNQSNPRKYSLPSVTLENGEYLVIFASGKDRHESYIHTNFKLSEGETLTLYSSNLSKVDSVEIPFMEDNMSMGRSGEDSLIWLFYPSPTPGKANTTRGFATPEEAVGRKGGPLIISEAISAVYNGEDWIELYNITDQALSLEGWFLSDNFNKPFRWAFPSGASIPAGGYLVVYASGQNKYDGSYHTDFKLNKYSEEIVLSWGELIMDVMPYGVMKAGVSLGVGGQDDTNRYYYTTPTPGKANSGNSYKGVSPKVNFALPSGQYDKEVLVEMYCMEEGAQIRYTLDGSTPKATSALYEGPFTITSNTPIRAYSTMEGRLSGEVVTTNYIIGTNHTLPIVFITTENNNMFNGGIYNSIYSDRRRVPVNITLVETDYSGFSEDVTINKHGNMTVFEAKKSFSVNFSETVGQNTLYYDLFPDDETRAKQFGNFLLRSGGNDWDDTMIKDGVLQTLGATQMDLDYQGFRPCVLYINGRYWGLYNIREKQNEEYLNTYHNADKDNVDIISFGHGVHSGNYSEYYKLKSFVTGRNLNDPANWEKLNEMMDVDNMIDTYLMHIYYSNYDTVNIKWWKEKTEDGKWRWFVYDLDYAIYVPAQNNLRLITNPAGHGVNNYFDSSLAYNLMKSQFFRQRFLERLSDYWGTIFNSDNLLTYWYSQFEIIAPEVSDNLSRWGISRSHFAAEMHQAYDFISRRPAYFRQMVKSYFGLSSEELDRLLPPQTITVKELNVLEVIDRYK